ncbi:amino acid permease [Kordiimonas sediminis]|uniref:Arginine/agmatine antiporter n=1 Tax=Kordiimonas sediminis TaxID=1735581 RepID=A0A919AK67_9PROT|nr:amino acid permease [Kordiimonas sediminis]GHF12117.1 amino acid permease [Kordiimonas sediminis]
MENSSAKKAIGFWGGWGLVVGGTIGSGIFMLPSVMAPYGLLGMGGWILCGIGALLLSLMLADLSSRLPKIGGPYAYARAGFGDFIGFWVGWGYWISLWSALAAIAIACVGYLGFFIPVLSSDPFAGLIATLAIVWGLTFLNLWSVEGASLLQLLTTILKILPLLLIAVMGFSMGSVDNMPDFNPSGGSYVSVLATSVTLLMWAFVGLEGGTVPADDMEGPDKTIPKILIAGTLTVLGVYLVSFVGVMLLMPAEDLAASSSPFADAGLIALGPVGAAIIAVGAIVSTFGATNAQVLFSGQIVRAMALDGLFPKKAGALSSRGTPVYALLISATLASILAAMNYTKGLVDAFVFMALLSTLTTLIPLAFAAVADLRLLQEEGSSRKRFRAGMVALLAFFYSLLVIYGAGEETVFYGFLLLMSAMPVYVLVKKKSKVQYE